MKDLPNLPGVKRDISSINPKLYKEFKASTSSLNGSSSPLSIRGTSNPFLVEDENDNASVGSLTNYDTAKLLELNSILSPYPSQASVYNDSKGRYSLVNQKKDRNKHVYNLPYSSLPNSFNKIGKVCNFLAYYVDKISIDKNNQIKPWASGYDNDSKEIIQRVEIKYYLEDNSIEILARNIPKISNNKASSTLTRILKRHSIIKPIDKTQDLEKDDDNVSKVYLIEDFKSGSELNIYNRIYTILDCDEDTRKYLSSINVHFGISLPFPSQEFDFSLNSTSSSPSKSNKSSPNLLLSPGKPLSPTSPSLSSSFSSPSLGGTVRKGKDKFFEYDRKVLRFFGVWDSRNLLFGEIIPVKIHYILADDTIEIVPLYDRNSGRDPLPTLLKRSKVIYKDCLKNNGIPVSNNSNNKLKNKKKHPNSYSELRTLITENASSVSSIDNIGIGICGTGPISSSIPRSYHWTDFKIGELYDIASVLVYITDADEFTRSFFVDNYIPLSSPILNNGESYVNSGLLSPSNNLTRASSFNDDDFSRTSISTANTNTSTSFLPQEIKRDGAKAKLFQGMVLRFNAKLNNSNQIDKTRQFIIEFHLEDDTIQIKEPTIRNSGFLGGIFLSRKKIVNINSTGSNNFIQASDFYIGANVNILSNTFTITNCDDFTFKYMESNAINFLYSDIQLINAKLVTKKPLIKSYILRLPGLTSIQVQPEDLIGIFINDLHLPLNEHEAYTLYRSIDWKHTNTLKLTRVLKYILDLA